MMARRTIDWELEARDELMESIGEHVDLDWDGLVEDEFGVSCRSDYDRLSVLELKKILDLLDILNITKTPGIS